MSNKPLDIEKLRERLSGLEGPAYWRGLEELAETDEFQEYLHREFPEGAAEWSDGASRRRFLKIMGASLALAGVGLTGCGSDPEIKIVPYVEQPEEVIPGKPLFFATAFPWGGYAQGVLVESHMGRPTKVEGNPDHPASLGATNAFMQASVLDLYDPDRSQNIRYRATISTWETFVRAIQEKRERWRQEGGEGLRLLTGTVTSPALSAQIDALLTQFPDAQWHLFDPISHDHAREGLRQAMGRYQNPIYRFQEANVVLSLDSDFLLTMPGSVRYAREFAERRRVRADETEMNRLYVLESSVTITGSMADHRLPLRPTQIERFARALAGRLGVAAEAPALPGEYSQWLDALGQDLQDQSGAVLIVAGETMPAEVHALVHAMNEALGAVGRTVEYIEPVEANPVSHRASLRSLVDDMAVGRVDTLVMLGGNPAYTAPADLEFEKHLMQVDTTIHLSTHRDETSFQSVWHVPRTHYLESWSDARAYDGTVSIIQPLIAPLYDPCRSEHEMMATLLGESGRTSYDIVRAHWRRQYTGERLAAFWRQALRDGVVPGTALPLAEGVQPEVRVGAISFQRLGPEREPEALRTQAEEAVADTTTAPDTVVATPPSVRTPDTLAAAPGAEPPAETNAEARPSPEAAGDLEIVFRPDPTLWDGAFANNGWLQELPKPVTKLVWDNAALISPQTAVDYDVENEQVVELHYRDRMVRAPVWIVPGHPDGTVTVYLGHGRPRAGRVGSGVGFNAYQIRTSDRPWTGTGLALRPFDEKYQLVTTQHHHSMEGRELVRAAAIERFRAKPGFIHEGRQEELPSLYPEYEYPDYKWGMVIDLHTCIGCNACVVACQLENNIPVVGKEEVRRGREMHWLRIDRYYKGDLDNPDTYFQPVPCMHCEKAPCEVVCPVYATVHDHQGLNVMVYNRCIGTRYCSNNCPYKVRRFNFLQYADWDTEILKSRRNPDVTVRSRGVMEKCTYCIQRIRAGVIRAGKEDRRIQDGEVMTACQMACPTQAIVFGDLNDHESMVHYWSEQPHNYALLHELGTRPRTTYLARFHNENAAVPKIVEAGFDIGQEEQIEVEVGTERDEKRQ